MKSSYKSKEDEVWEGLYPRIFLLIKTNKWTLQSVGASLGLGGGILSIIAATLLPFIASWLTPGNFLLLEKISNVSIGLILPLLALGAHCLDLLEKKSSALSSL
jgi:hypothetical protein